MSRWIRSWTGIFSSAGRYPIRVNSQLRSGEIHNVQTIIFQKPPLLQPKRIAVFVGASVACGAIYKSMVLDPLDQFYEDLDKNMDEKTRKALEKAAEEDGNNPWFFPFPFTVNMVKPQPYKGSDPEWKEYVRISHDTELGTRIRGDLAELVRTTCAKHPHVRASLGAPIKLRRVWLDIDYPVVPPPTYERSGIEITDDYIAWSTVPVDSLTVSRVQRALWPTAMFHSLWAFVNVLSVQNSSRFGTLVGREAKQQPSFDTLVALHKTRSATPPADSSSTGISSVPTTRTPDPSGAPKQPDIINALPTTKKTQSIEEEDEKPVFTGGELVRDSFTQVQEHMKTARLAFKQKFASVWSPPMELPPRGSVVVAGVVELTGPRANVVLEVRSFWNPKTQAFDNRNTRLVVKRVQPRTQRPAQD